ERESIEDEPEEHRAGAVVGPPQQRRAAGTEREVPREAGKPRELRRRSTLRCATRCLAEATDVENETGGIHAAVLMMAADLDALSLGCDRVTACRAHNAPSACRCVVIFGDRLRPARRVSGLRSTPQRFVHGLGGH